MNTLRIPFDFSLVPAAWQLCFCDGCPQHEQCLRYQAGQFVPDSITWGPAVYPSAYRNGQCPHFKPIRTIRAAYGFATLFSEVKEKDAKPLHDKLKAYLGGHGTYYRYNSGEKLLVPEQQEWILALFRRYGYADNLRFDHNVDVLDFS